MSLEERADSVGDTSSPTRSAGARPVSLNSQKVTRHVLRSLAAELGLHTSAPTADLRLMVDGKLADKGREPKNVLVIIERETTEAEEPGRVQLHDNEGAFLEAELLTTTETPVSSDISESEAVSPLAVETDDRTCDREATLTAERDQLVAVVERYRTELESSRAERERAKTKIEGIKKRLKEVWKMNCDQSILYDEELAAKETEIAELHRRLSVAPSTCSCRSSMEITEAGESRLRHSPTVGIGAGPRRGKAPPVDSFSGDDGVTCFDDWLPSLERAASWNAWTDEEKLLQLAGHLRWRALQEWNLISTEDRMTFVDAVKSLRARVDPENCVLAGQEFRHAIQESDESVPRYIRRLERLFQMAYGRDRLRVEIREILFYSQLQEGLRYTLIKSPAVSGADSYGQLCIATRHEEKRLNELARRQQYHKENSKRAERPQLTTTTNSSGKSSEKPQGEARRCYICGDPDHLARACRRRKTESTGQARRATQSTGAGTRMVKAKEDPLDFLQSDSDDEEEQAKKGFGGHTGGASYWGDRQQCRHHHFGS